MRTCFFVLVRMHTEFDGYVGNRALATHIPVDEQERPRNWQTQIRQMIRQWNVLVLPQRD